MRWWLCSVGLMWFLLPWACKLYVPPEGAFAERDETAQEPVELAAQDGANTESVGELSTVSVPATAEEWLTYLRKGGYRAWPQESKPHLTQGPHKSGAMVFINEVLLKSLQAGNASHPQGAIAIKELFEIDLQTPAGWSVMAKVEDDSQGGAGWYWFEVFTSSLGDRLIADGKGVQLCTGCHLPGKDFFLTTFPLQ